MRLIDADALKGEKFYSHERHENCVSVYAIDMMPTIEPDRPHSEWLPMITKDDYGEQVLGYKCKRCGWLKPHDKMPFCENCGADMRKESDLGGKEKG